MPNYPRCNHSALKPLILIVACTVALLFCTQCTLALTVTDDAIEFQMTECWAKVDRKAPTDCGWLIVPEDWEKPHEQKLKLPVVVFRARNPDPSLNPIIYLSGGPGLPALGPNGNDIAGWGKDANSIYAGRTLVVFDQRGTGLSMPKLECRDGDSPMIWHPVSKNREAFGDLTARVHAAYSACAARHLAAGRRLTAFNTLQSANDVEALRRALNLDDVVLWGISYGTRLAMAVMELYPETVSAAILDSIFLPQAVYPTSKTGVFGAVLDRLFKACHADERCAEAYPDLRDRLLRALAQLEKDPAIIEITNFVDSDPLYARIDHTMFLSVLYDQMYSTARVPGLPTLISGVAQGEYWRLKSYVEYIVFGGRFPGNLAMGVTLAMTCNDNAERASKQTSARDPESYPYLEKFVAGERELWPCAIWPTKPTTRNHAAVSGDIPALLLAGGFDPATTVEMAEIAAESLSASHLFIFPASGHVQIRDNPCAWEIIREFLSSPVKRPSPKCLTSLRQPAFLVVGGN